MPLRPLLPAILLALVVSVVVGVLAAGRDDGITLSLAAFLFALQIVFAILRTNTPYWRAEAGNSIDTAAECVRRNTVLGGIVYAWGAASMLAIYSLPGPVWQHWWQYGVAMAIVGAGIFIYAGMLAAGRGSSARALWTLVMLSILQGIAVTGVVIYLVWSGKLFTTRGDWAANYIFAAGGVMLALLSLISIATYLKIVGDADPKA